MHVRRFFGKNAKPLWVVIGIEVLGAVLMMLGVLPREAALFLLGIFVFFVLFAPLKQAALFTVFSIPFYTALPITESFDSMAAWRIIAAILFLRFLFMKLSRLDPRKLLVGTLQTRLGIFVGVFFALGALSLFAAQEPIFGIKKLLFLANAVGLFFVVRAVVKSRQDFVDVLKYIFAGAMFALGIGYAQFVTILFAPLYIFWQWWASHVIPVFYGAGLGNLLSYSNTWFSYYEKAEPTLRMFSVFPDSHSFALSLVLSLPAALTFFVAKKGPARLFFGLSMVLILLAIIFSGTRGVWVGAAPVFFALIALYVARKEFRKTVVKTSMMAFLILAVLFPVSSQLLKFSQMRQGGIVSETTFERLSTSFNARELSNLGRIQIWKSTFSSIAKKPILGVGMGNYPVVLNENVSAAKEGASAHSLYLDAASEMGIAGGIILFLIFLEILWRAVRTFLQEEDFFLSAFAGFFAVYFLWVMTYSVVDVVLLNDKVLLSFAALLGLLYSIPLYARKH